MNFFRWLFGYAYEHVMYWDGDGQKDLAGWYINSIDGGYVFDAAGPYDSKRQAKNVQQGKYNRD